MPEELETTWNLVRRELRQDAPDFTFHIWLEPLELAGRRGDTLYVRAPGHIRTWVRERHQELVRRAVKRALGPSTEIEIVAEDWSPEQLPTAPDARHRGAPTTPEALNPKYIFDQFVIGDGNRLGHAAALAVAEQPGQAYNPLFLYGEPGLGKTHLLHAIGNYVQLYGNGLRVRYSTIEDFTAEFVRATRGRDTTAFRERFRGADVLLVDDVQFLADKMRTKEEFFHTFNALYESGRQLVLTSDRPPADHDEFESRLRERFASGLVADIQPPELDVRLAILRKRARLDALSAVPDETLLEIARSVTASVRALEGALIRVIAYASLRGEAPTPGLASKVLATLYPAGTKPSARPTVDAIQTAAAEEFGLDTDALLAHDRRPNIAYARQVAMYLARELTDETLPAIGRRFGRNHATVLHAHRKIADQLKSDDSARSAVNSLRRRLGGEPSL